MLQDPNEYPTADPRALLKRIEIITEDIRLQARTLPADSTMRAELLCDAEAIELDTVRLTALLTGTPPFRWDTNGEGDPHKGHYDKERAALSMGYMTDDELANGAFMNYDQRPPIEKIINGTALMPIVWMTAVKDRIRWLARALDKAMNDPINKEPLAKRRTSELFNYRDTINAELKKRGNGNAAPGA